MIKKRYLRLRAIVRVFIPSVSRFLFGTAKLAILKASIPRPLLWIFVCLAALAAYLVAIKYSPVVLNEDLRTAEVDTSGSPLPPLTRGERLTAAHNARFLVVSLSGALVVLGGLLYTARNYRLANRGQATERFTKALERLGSEELYVRIGGIYALHQLLVDSRDHHSDILGVLVAFIRQQVPRVRIAPEADSRIYPPSPLPSEPTADVQAAFTALCIRPHRPSKEQLPLHLARLHLQNIDLAGVSLRNVDFSGSCLEGANFRGARLRNLILAGSDLTNSNLQQSHMKGIDLSDADLSNSDFRLADLRNVDLRDAKLNNAMARGVEMRGVDLTGAQLECTNLRGSCLVDVDFTATTMKSTVLRHSDIREIKNWMQYQLDEAILSRHTLLPEGANPVDE